MWLNSPTYAFGPIDNDGAARNHSTVDGTACVIKNTTTAAIVNVSTTGALYVILSFTLKG